MRWLRRRKPRTITIKVTFTSFEERLHNEIRYWHAASKRPGLTTAQRQERDVIAKFYEQALMDYRELTRPDTS